MCHFQIMLIIEAFEDALMSSRLDSPSLPGRIFLGFFFPQNFLGCSFSFVVCELVFSSRFTYQVSRAFHLVLYYFFPGYVDISKEISLPSQ